MVKPSIPLCTGDTTILDEIFVNFSVFLQYNSKPQVNGNWFNRLERDPLQLELQKVNIEH